MEQNDNPPVKLYQLTDRLRDLQDALMEAGGVLTEEMEEELDALEGALEEKLERTFHLIRQMEATAAARKALLGQYDEERARLSALVKAGEASAKSLREYVMHELRRQGRTEVDTPTFRAKIRKATRPAIRWVRDLKDLPERFRKVTVEADTAAAWDELRAKRPLPEGFAVAYSEWLDLK